MIASLERLGGPPKEDLQQVHASHVVADKLNHSTNQHFDLGLFFRRHFQRSSLLGSFQRERGKSSRLTRSRLVFAVKPGRLPTTDRFRESDGWKGAFSPCLDRQAPAQLDHLRPFVTRLGLFDRLRTASEDVLKESPMGAATQETLTQGNESSQIHDRVGSEVVELRSEEIQETPEKGMRRQRKPAIDMGGEEHTLTMKRLGLASPPREARSFRRDASSLNHIVKIFLPQHRRHPVALHPAF